MHHDKQREVWFNSFNLWFITRMGGCTQVAKEVFRNDLKSVHFFLYFRYQSVRPTRAIFERGALKVIFELLSQSHSTEAFLCPVIREYWPSLAVLHLGQTALKPFLDILERLDPNLGALVLFGLGFCDSFRASILFIYCWKCIRGSENCALFSFNCA